VVSLDFHTTSDSGDGFSARQISDMDKSIIERSEDSSNSEDEFSFSGLEAKGDVFLLVVNYTEQRRREFICERLCWN
jgi:hypothetical protein